MLRASSLPPSMAKRERIKPKMNVCPRSFRDSITDDTTPKKCFKIPNYKAYHDRLEKELEDLKNDFVSTSPRPFKLKTLKRVDKCSMLMFYTNCFQFQGRKNFANSSSGSKSSSSKTTSSCSSYDYPSINRSNLAAVLRMQSAR